MFLSDKYADAIPRLDRSVSANDDPREVLKRRLDIMHALCKRSATARYCWNEVCEFFNNDLNKATIWFWADNPRLGGISPLEMFFIGRGHVVKKFIDSAKEGHHP